MIHTKDKTQQWEKWENQGLWDRAALKTSWAQLVRSKCCSLAGSLGFLAPPAAPWVLLLYTLLALPSARRLCELLIISWLFHPYREWRNGCILHVILLYTLCLHLSTLAQLFKNNVLFLCSLLFIPWDRDKIHKSIQDPSYSSLRSTQRSLTDSFLL